MKAEPMKTLSVFLSPQQVARLKPAYDCGMASGEGRELDRKVLLEELKAEIANAWRRQ